MRDCSSLGFCSAAIGKTWWILWKWPGTPVSVELVAQNVPSELEGQSSCQDHFDYGELPSRKERI